MQMVEMAKGSRTCLDLHFLTTAYLLLIMETEHIIYHLIKREREEARGSLLVTYL